MLLDSSTRVKYLSSYFKVFQIYWTGSRVWNPHRPDSEFETEFMTTRKKIYYPRDFQFPKVTVVTGTLCSHNVCLVICLSHTYKKNLRWLRLRSRGSGTQQSSRLESTWVSERFLGAWTRPEGSNRLTGVINSDSTGDWVANTREILVTKKFVHFRNRFEVQVLKAHQSKTPRGVPEKESLGDFSNRMNTRPTTTSFGWLEKKDRG